MLNLNELELSIKELEFRYLRLFETAQDGIIILNADTGQIVDVNPYLIKLLGYSKAEFLDKKIWELQNSQSSTESKSRFKKLQKENYVRYEDLPLETKDKQLINVEFVSNVYEVGKKRVIQCNIRDITERKKIELKLELETAKQEAILSSVGDGIIATGVNGKILVMNIAAQKILGWNIQEIVGGVLSEIVTIENEQGNLIPLNIENVVISDAFYIRRDKTKIPVAVNIKPIFWTGKMVGAVIVFRDRSKEAEVEKVKEEILLRTIHDLRAPSNAIRLAAEIYSDPEKIAKNPNSLKEGVKLIQEANLRMQDLINSLLESSKNESKSNKAIQVDIGSVLKNIIKEVNLAALKKKIKITYNSLDKKPYILANFSKMQEIFSNIIDNSIKYNKIGGTTIINEEIEDNFLKVIIEDTGIGISDQDLEKIFTPYFRAEKEEKIQGTGLGLYITKKLVMESGGKIEIKSVLGVGTTFIISLPII